LTVAQWKLLFICTIVFTWFLKYRLIKNLVRGEMLILILLIYCFCIYAIGRHTQPLLASCCLRHMWKYRSQCVCMWNKSVWETRGGVYFCLRFIECMKILISWWRKIFLVHTVRYTVRCFEWICREFAVACMLAIVRIIIIILLVCDWSGWIG